MIGRTIGKYRIVGQLGRGGMGTVYRAIDESLDREVAIKVLNPELADSDIIKRFRAEATTLARLNHPEIATIYELFRSETDLLMVMEFVRGETLDKLSERLGPFEPDRAAYLIDKVLSALEHAHRAGIVHRDMKPANVMVTQIGGVKIMDFGIARVRGAEHMTVDGFMMGTPAYMPPEQVLGQEVDGRADLYSVGVVFYRLLTGALPFKADTAIGMVQKQISEAPTPLSAYREGLPDWCDTILQRALTKSPADRFQTAEEFRAALAKATGMSTIEHTRAFATVDLETTTPPQPLKLERALTSTPSAPPAGRAPTPPSPPAAPPSAPTASGQRPVAVDIGPAAAPPAQASSASDGATIVLRKRHFALAAAALAGIVLAVALAVGLAAYLALRRPLPLPSDTGVAASAAASPVAAAPAATNAVPAPPAPVAAGAAAPTQTGASELAPPAAASAPGTPPSAAATEKPAGARTGRGAAAKPADPAVPLRLFLPLAFDAKAFVLEDGRPRERDAQVVLADGRITVTPKDGPNPLHDVTYESVLSISYSRGRDPLWNSPAGPLPVARASGGALGIFRGERHWVSVRTMDRFLVMRLDNGSEARRAMTALQERTGKAAELVAERKDAR